MAGRGNRDTSLVLSTHLSGCRWFWTWALIGCAAAFGFVSLGVLAAGPAALVGVSLARRPAARRSAFGFVSGVGVLLLYVAWVQRTGEHLNPLPWLLAGVALLASGILGHGCRR